MSVTVLIVTTGYGIGFGPVFDNWEAMEWVFFPSILGVLVGSAYGTLKILEYFWK